MRKKVKKSILITLLFLIILGLYHIKKNKELESKEVGDVVGYLSIDRLDLSNIEVREGTNFATLDKAIGKYENQGETQKNYNGNLCLFSNSTGDEKSYFKNIRDLTIGDSIIYKTNGEIIQYAVYEIDLLDYSDKSFLEVSEDSTITLVTQAGKSSNMNVVVRANECSRKENNH